VQAKLLTNGLVKLVLPEPNLLLLNWALWTTITALDRDEKWFRELSGISPAQAWSIADELLIVRYALRGEPRWLDPKTGELAPPLEPRKTGTAWDDLPKIKAENLRDHQVAVILPQEKFAVFPELLEASLVYVAPYRTEEEKSAFRLRFATSTGEAEALRDALRRLGREMRAKSAARSDL
jgi:hypothetical protein